jgi:hypothetical protein|nr:MAG TPA: hypothetical protein [Caudoviricetes sp.]
MAPTYSELVKELYPLYEQEPTRFMHFYNAVYMKLLSIQEGEVLRIADHCSKKTMNMFIKVASLFIIEETCRKSITDDLLEFSDDYSMIKRCCKFIPSHPYRKEEKRL